jgi:hypothetical protein
LTPDQINAVARNLIGHMTTDPKVRASITAVDATAGDAHAQYAAAIAAATQSAVDAEDVPAVLAAVKQVAAATSGFELEEAAHAIAFNAVYVKAGTDPNG